MQNKENKERIEEIESDLHDASSLATVGASKGGKLLIESLVKDIINTVDKLCVSHATMTHQEFIALSATMKSNKDLLDVLTKAKGNKDFLDKLLKEALQDE